jgi:hypothetical protein
MLGALKRLMHPSLSPPLPLYQPMSPPKTILCSVTMDGSHGQSRSNILVSILDASRHQSGVRSHPLSHTTVRKIPMGTRDKEKRTWVGCLEFPRRVSYARETLPIALVEVQRHPRWCFKKVAASLPPTPSPPPPPVVKSKI